MEMKGNFPDLGDVFPLMGCIGDALISKRGEITLGWELTLPREFCLLEKDYDEMVRLMASAIRVLPPFVMVHRQDVFVNREYRPEGCNSFLGAAAERHFSGRKCLEHRSRLYLTLSRKALVSKDISGSGLIARFRTTSDFPSGEAVRGFVAKATEFVSILTGSGRVSARTITSDEWLGGEGKPGLIQSYLTLGREDLQMTDFRLEHERVVLDRRSLVAYSIRESDSLPGNVPTCSPVTAMSGAGTPLLLSYGATAGELLDCEHIVNSYILTCPQQDVINSLTAKMRRMQSMSKDAENRVNAEEINRFEEERQKDTLTVVRAHTNILAWDDSGNETALCGKVSSALALMGVNSVKATCDVPVLWYAGIPGAGCELGADNLMTMELMSALCLGIYEGGDTGVPGGRIRMVDRLSHCPVRLDIQDLAGTGNYNAIVIGGSGAGKSFLCNHLLSDLYDAGEAVYIIDVGGSYELQCAVHREESEGRNGIYMTWEGGDQPSFNAFEAIHDWVETLPDGRRTLCQDAAGLKYFVSVLQTLWTPSGGWEGGAQSTLYQLVSDFAMKHCNDEVSPVFDDFLAFLHDEIAPLTAVDEHGSHIGQGYSYGRSTVWDDTFDIRELLEATEQYSAGGIHSSLLNDRHPKDLFSSDFTVFEMNNISKGDSTYYSLVILSIINAFDIRMRSDRNRMKVLAIDEAWTAIANRTMAPFLAELWRTARKYNASAWVITQNASDIVSSPVIRDALLINTDHRFILDQSGSGSSFPALVELLSIGERDRAMIESINKGLDSRYPCRQVFISSGDSRSGVYCTEVSPEAMLAYESKFSRKEPTLQEMRRTGSIITAIRNLVGQKGN